MKIKSIIILVIFVIIVVITYRFVIGGLDIEAKNQAVIDKRSKIMANQIKDEQKDSVKKITIKKDYLLGHFEPKKDSNFVEIEIKYANRTGQYLHKQTYEAFKKMADAAMKEGLELKIISATRNFDKQKNIWERKWTGVTKVEGNNLATTIEKPEERALEILKFSSMPGTSRHHWGTDIDINSLENNYFESGYGEKLYEWLNINAATYGFYQPYTEKNEKRPNGYEMEKWHWSYVPLAKHYLNSYKKLVNYDDIENFKGAGIASYINVIENYVFGINPEILNK